MYENIHNTHSFACVRFGLSCQNGVCVMGQRDTGGWFDVAGRGGGRGWLPGLSAGAGELEGHVHKLLPVCRWLIEKAGEGTGPLICGPTHLLYDPKVFTHSACLCVCLSVTAKTKFKYIFKYYKNHLAVLG